jgi:hypothetical protein
MNRQFKHRLFDIGAENHSERTGSVPFMHVRRYKNAQNSDWIALRPCLAQDHLQMKAVCMQLDSFPLDAIVGAILCRAAIQYTVIRLLPARESDVL